MHYNQQPLPVSAEQPMQNQFVQGNQLPPLPNIPEVGQVEQQEAFSLHGELITLLQNGVQKGPVRIFLFNLYSQNHYVNQTYMELYGSAIEYYLFLKASGQPDARRAADESVKCEIPRVIQNYPALQNYLNDQQMNDLHQFVQLATAISQQMQTFYAQQQHGGGGWNNQPANQYPPQGGPGAHRPGPAMQFGGGGFTGQPSGGRGMPSPPGGGRPGAGGWSQPNQPIQQTTRRSGMGGPNAGSMLNQNTNAGAPTAGGSRRPSVGTPTTSSLNTNPGVVPAAQQGDEMRRVSPDDRELGHLSEVREATRVPAPPIDREVEFISSAYIPARRRDQRIVITIKDGRKEYGVVDLEEHEMDYDDHETNPNMIELSRKQRTGPKVAPLPEWDQVSVPSEVSSEETPDEDHTTLEENEPLILKESVMAYSIKHARMLALDALGKVDVAPSDARVFEYYVDLITPLGSQSIADQIQKMREAVDLTQLVDLFNEAAEELPPRVWYQLHDRMTETLNRRLRGGLSFQADIDSITDDYDDLMDLLAKDYSNTAVDRFKRNVKAHILRTMNMREVSGKLLLSEPVSVTELPWTSRQIDLILESKYSMLSTSVNSHMYTAALKLFKRTNTKDCNMSRRLLVTVDNVMIELHHGDMGNDTLLISKNSFCG
jgi:hypothetical protein